MTKEEKLKKIELLKKQASDVKKEVDYYNALQLALKLVLNGSYGAFATSYFILYNNHVAGTITAQGRDLTRTMDKVNEDYWYNQWHLDHELHFKLGIKEVTQINKNEPVSIYADTDSLFVSFKPAIDHCVWKDLVFNNDYLNSLDSKFIILTNDETKTSNPNCVGVAHKLSELEQLIKSDYDLLANYKENLQSGKIQLPNDSEEWQYFLQYAKQYPEMKPYRTEWMIYHEDLKIAGSVDMVYRNPDGTLLIYDWKRCKEIVKVNAYGSTATTECVRHLPDTNFWHYALQLNTYKNIIEQKYGAKVVGLCLVCLHPDNSNGSYRLLKCRF